MKNTYVIRSEKFNKSCHTSVSLFLCTLIISYNYTLPVILYKFIYYIKNKMIKYIIYYIIYCIEIMLYKTI